MNKGSISDLESCAESNFERIGRSAVICAICGFLAMALPGCSLPGSFDFREEVQLSNGEVLTVFREVKASPLGEIGGTGGWAPRYMSLEIITDGIANKPLKWESTEGLVPLLLDRDPTSSEWVLLTKFYMCDAWEKLGQPRHPYAEFRFRAGTWQRIELTDQWFGRTSNVYTSVSSDGEPELLTLVEKSERHYKDRPGLKYRSIINDWNPSGFQRSR